MTERKPTVPLPLLVLLAALAPLSMDAVLPSLPALEHALDVGRGGGQAVIGSFALGFALGQLLWGPLADRYGRRPVLLGGLAAFGCCNLGIVLMPDLRAIVVWRALAGLAACAGMVLSRTLVIDTTAPAERGRVIGALASAMFLAPALGPVVGGFLQEAFGWRAIFCALTVEATALVAWIGFRFGETLEAPDLDALKWARMRATWGQLLSNPRFLRPSLVVAAMSAAMFAFITASPSVLMKTHGLSPTGFGVAYMSITAAFIVGARIGRRAEVGRAKPLVVVALVAAAVAGASILALASGRVGANASLGWFVGSAGLFYGALGITMPLSMAAGLRDCEAVGGRAAALQGFLQAMAGALASATVGWIPDATVGIGAFIVVGALASMGFLAGAERWTRLPDVLRSYVRVG